MNERRGGAVEPLHIGRGWERVDVSFASFICAKEKEGIRGNEINKVIYEKISLCICDTAVADLGIIV